jgi:hypothetical protein
MNDLGKGIHPTTGEKSAPRANAARFGFKESDIKTLHDAARRRIPMKLISRAESPMSFERTYHHPAFNFAHDMFRLLDHLATLETYTGRISYFSAVSGATGGRANRRGRSKAH